jgi:hypothetical protein
MDYQCSHNLFWKGLRLNPDKFKITNRSLEIGNCCCLINEPWTAEEIGAVWGVAMGKIMRCEGIAWEKIHKKSGLGHNQIERFFLHWINKKIHKTTAIEYSKRSF